MPLSIYKHTCNVENAPKFLDWIRNRGGVAVWHSVDLSDIGRSWSTPALQQDGTPTPKQHWKMDSKPAAIYTDPKEIGVCVDKEVKRFHVAVRRGSQGLSFKCTDASSRRIRNEVAKAGEGAYHVFDYGTQEAIIMAPTKVQSLEEWTAEQQPKTS